MTNTVIETEVKEEDNAWDMEDSSNVKSTKADDSLHVIILSEDKDKKDVYIDKMAQVIGKQLASADKQAQAIKGCQKARLKRHALEVVDNLATIPKAIIYQLGSRQVRVTIKESYRAVAKSSYDAIKEYAPDFAKVAFNAVPEIAVKSPLVPKAAIPDVQKWLEKGRKILSKHGVGDPNSVITFTNKFQPKTTTNELRSKQNVIIQEALQIDLPLGTTITTAKVGGDK